MPDIKWSAFPDANAITSGDDVVGLRAGGNVRLTANAFDNLLLDTNTISSTDAAGNINLNPDTTGLVVIQGSTGIDAIIDDDTMAAASATNIPTSESIKAYVDASAGGGVVVSEATGVLTGGVLSTGTAATEYSISDGTGQVIAADGTVTPVSWTGKTNITPVALLTANISFVGITSAGAVIESTAAFTNLELRTIIQLGVAVHVNRTTVDAVNNEQHISYNTNCQLNDLTDAIGFFNVSGNIISPNGANLNIDKSAGDMYGVGVNYAVDVNNPNVLTLAILTAATFQYRFSDGSNGVTGTAVDPDNLDDGAGGLTPLGGNKWSVQRAYSFTSNNLKLQRGQIQYGSKDKAIAGITSGSFVTEPSIAANGLLRGFLVIKEGTTNLSDTGKAVFVEATRFQAAAGGIGSTASTLQEVYDNSAANPEILTNATQGAFTVRRGSGADTDDIYQGQNNAATKTFSVDGNGLVTATSINFGQDALNYYDEGTFTPTFSCDTVGDLSVAYATQAGNYTRIGNKVYISVGIAFTPTFTTASGSIRILGMPFAGSASITSGLMVRYSSAGITFDTGYTQLASYSEAATTYLRVSQLGSTQNGLKLQISRMVSGVANQFTLSGFYTI